LLLSSMLFIIRHDVASFVSKPLLNTPLAIGIVPFIGIIVICCMWMISENLTMITGSWNLSYIPRKRMSIANYTMMFIFVKPKVKIEITM
jgi:hypothetical protein